MKLGLGVPKLCISNQFNVVLLYAAILKILCSLSIFREIFVYCRAKLRNLPEYQRYYIIFRRYTQGLCALGPGPWALRRGPYVLKRRCHWVSFLKSQSDPKIKSFLLIKKVLRTPPHIPADIRIYKRRPYIQVVNDLI